MHLIKIKNKIKHRIFFALTWAIIISFVSNGSTLFAAQEPRGTSNQPIILTSGEGNVVINQPPTAVLAPEGLTATEQANLERQYRFTVRDKGSLLSPYIAAEDIGIVADQATEREQTEQEKLYRYFGVAAALHKEDKLEEAVEILKYILERSPDDEYVRHYLAKVINEQNFQKNRWRVSSEDDAHLLRKQKLKNLVKDGVDYYKQEEYDMALLKFSDAVSLDPNNLVANTYLDKLKTHYAKEVRVGNIVENYEAGTAQKDDEEDQSARQNDYQKERALEKLMDDKERKIDDSARKLLDKKEDRLDRAARQLLNDKEGRSPGAAEKLLEAQEDGISKTTNDLLDREEMKSVVMEKRLSGIMDKAELGLTVKEIIAQKKDLERKANIYTLGIGDVIQISIRDHPELSGKALVRLNGEVLLPLVNDLVKVKGLTVEEASARIKEAMKRYIREPFVTVSIEDYKSKIFYVIDEIGCTPYPITRTNLTLRDALFVADWGDNRALGRVIVIKPDKVHPVVKKVDAFDLIYRGNLVHNVRIEDGDVIYIPLTMAAKITKVVNDTIAPFRAVRTARDEWLDQRWNQEGYFNMGRIPRNADIQDDLNSGAGGVTTNT